MKYEFRIYVGAEMFGQKIHFDINKIQYFLLT
jgi:hypothetical protein